MTFSGLGRGTAFRGFPPPQRALLGRYASAFETSDVDLLVDVLAETVTWEMPPDSLWFAGRDHVTEFLAARMLDHGGLRSMPTMANGQPAFAFYAGQDDGSYRPYSLHVLTLVDACVSRVVAFGDPRMFPLFGMPPVP